MSIPFASAAGEIYDTFAQTKLPRWSELPDLELYMDQVLALIERYLITYPGYDGKGLTASMVNNYVKLGIIPPPIKKKYTREHLAHLIVICLLKASLPMASIQRLMTAETENLPLEIAYDRFCEMFEQTGRSVAASVQELTGSQNDGEESLKPIWHAALRAQAEQALAIKLLSIQLPESKKS